MVRTGARSHNGDKVMLTVHVSRETADLLDRFQKMVSAGRWRRSEMVTKGDIVDEALRRYIAEQVGPDGASRW